MGHVPIEVTSAGFAVSQAGRRLVANTLPELIVQLGLLPESSPYDSAPPATAAAAALYDGEAPAVRRDGMHAKPRTPLPVVRTTAAPGVSAAVVSEPAPALYANMASLPPLNKGSNYVQMSDLPPINATTTSTFYVQMSDLPPMKTGGASAGAAARAPRDRVQAVYAEMSSLPPLKKDDVNVVSGSNYVQMSDLPPIRRDAPADANRRAAARAPAPACPWLISEHDLQFEDKELGSGSSGQVRRARWNGSLVAVKQLSGTHTSTEAYAMQAFQNELARMHKLPPHPNVMSFFGSVIFESGALAAVLELCADGALVDSLYGDAKKSDWTIRELLDVAHDCACGLSHLHSNLIVHRDLAARNVLLTSGHGRKLFAKLCDLGLSRLLADRDSEQQTVTPEVDSNGAVIRREWLAPEQIMSSVYSLSTDVFAFGVLLFEIFARQAPWAHLAHLPNSAVGMRVLRGERLQAPEAAPSSIRTLMIASWDTKPQQRPPISKLRELIADEIEAKKR
jgi:hypothetical protein